MKLYIAEPDVIDLDLVRTAMADRPFELVEGNAAYTQGDTTCDTLVIRSVAQVDATILQKMPQLKRVVRVGTGLDNVDLDFCAAHNIAVYNAPGANAEAVADYAVTTTLMVLRKLHLLQQTDVRDWNRFKFVGQDIATRTIGIVGFGNIGKLVYQKFAGLGCRDFAVYDPFVKEVPEHARLAELDDVVQSCDVISLHLPLLPQTKYCIGAQNIGRLKEDAIVLNASRGGIVNEKAVVQALKTQHFTYIADTVESEPHVNPQLIGHENIVITPHIASLTQGADAAMVTQAMHNMLTDKQAVVLGR